MSTAKFRLAQATDIDLLVCYMRTFYAIDDYAFNEGAARAALEEFIDTRASGSIWLIEVDGHPIGYVALTLCYSFEYHGRNAYIDELFIDSAYRGQGIGRQTLAFVEGECLASRVKALHLEVERSNAVGQALYRKHGFVDHDRYLMTRWLMD
ncbi:MAG: GNAT family N-acetyltransferase [Acidobacteriota bacterium]